MSRETKVVSMWHYNLLLSSFKVLKISILFKLCAFYLKYSLYKFKCIFYNNVSYCYRNYVRYLWSWIHGNILFRFYWKYIRIFDNSFIAGLLFSNNLLLFHFFLFFFFHLRIVNVLTLNLFQNYHYVINKHDRKNNHIIKILS